MEAQLDVVFLWHMHQPDYRLPGDDGGGEHVLPWVYLHAIKDYADMAAHLERHPGIRAVVNFVPVLVAQIDDYVDQLTSGRLRDPLLRLLAHPEPESMSAAERRLALQSCFRGNGPRMIDPFPAYKRLQDLFRIVEGHGESAQQYLSGRYVADLLTWYHLSWTGESLRRQEPLLAQLMTRGEGFTLTDRLQLLDLIRRTLAGLVPRYRALAERGQVELSATPYAHPLAPLLLDFHSAREALPELPLPQAPGYPGGRDRVDAHIVEGSAEHARHFGTAPVGLWPAEGAVSAALLQRFAAHDCRWAATGEGVLRNSLGGTGLSFQRERDLYRPYKLADGPDTALFFRDDRLSDLIGFEYANWHGKDAAQHFVAQLEAIRLDSRSGERPLVTVALDGENAWEYYPYNGHYFFEDLYRLLEEHPYIRTGTFAECLADPERIAGAAVLPRLVAGSWVYGSMTTWIGDVDKNRAWDLLCEAKQSYDLVVGGGRLEPAAAAAAAARLAVCESSDWFWWFGDYNPPAAVAQFDQLFRANLRHLYVLLGLPPPETLADPISHGSGHPEAGGTMRRNT